VQAAPAGAGTEAAEAALRDGHLLVVRSLLRVLPRALAAKAAADAAIDACGAMQNLRTAIARYRGTLMGEPREDKRARILSVCTVRRFCRARPRPPGSVCVVHLLLLSWWPLSLAPAGSRP
jgi:hypothetical protein